MANSVSHPQPAQEQQHHPRRPHRNILRRLPPSLSIDSAQTPTSRPLTSSEREILSILNKLKEFLANAPNRWASSEAPSTTHLHNPNTRPALNRFTLPSNEFVTCVLWQGQHYITGTDIVRSLVFRFEAFGRPVRNMKKFEEGVFSDLRNLKPGSDATLEEPKVSPILYKKILSLAYEKFLSCRALSWTFFTSTNAFVPKRSKRSFIGMQSLFYHFVRSSSSGSLSHTTVCFLTRWRGTSKGKASAARQQVL